MDKKIMAVFLLCIVVMAALQFSTVYADGETGGAGTTGTAGGAAGTTDTTGGAGKTGTTGGAGTTSTTGGAGPAARPPKTMFSRLADKFRNMV